MRASILALTMFFSWFTANPLSGAEPAPDPGNQLREQSIYIPYDKLQETFEKEGRGVFVPYERFQELWKAARASTSIKPHEGPPVKAMITEIDSRASVEQDVVRVQATAKIDLLASGWLTIPLRLSDAAVLSATVDEDPARLIPHDGGQALLIKKESDEPEQITLKLEYAKGFTKAPGQNSVSFQAPLAPVNRWQIRVPEEGIKVNVHPMLAATELTAQVATPKDANPDSPEIDPAEPDADIPGTVVLAFVGAAPSVKIDWTPKSQGATGLEALVSVQTQQQIDIAEGVTRTRTTLTYEVSRAELPTLNIEVPGDQKVVNVLDANVRGWNVEVEGDIQRVTVDLFQPAKQTQQIVIELEKFRDEAEVTEIAVTSIKAVGVGRQRGIVIVQVAPELRAESTARNGLSQMDLQEIPAPVRADSVAMAYRYAALPFELGLKVEKVQPRISVDQLVEAYVDPREITYTLLAKYGIQRAGVFELACQIPEGYDVRNVSGHACDGATAAAVESHALDAEDSSTLRINLGSKAVGNVGLLIELSKALDEPNLVTPTGENAELEFIPPRVSGEFIIRSTGRLVVYAPESLRATSAELTGVRTISFEEAFKPFASATHQRFASLRPALAYEFSGESEATAKVHAQRRQPQVTARQLLVARIEPGVVKYTATFFFNVRYSGVESLRVDIPDAIAAKIQNETRSLREAKIEPAPDDALAGYTAMSFTGDTELLGNTQFKLTWEETIDELGVGKSVDLDVPRLLPQDVTRADGQVVLAKAETIDIRPKGVAQGLDPIDPQVDLMEGVTVPDAAVALEFRDGPWDLALTATRYSLEMLKHTSVEQGVLQMVVTRSDRVAVQSLYRLRSSMQRLKVELPYDVAAGGIEFDTEPLRINGRAVTLERGEDARTFYVPLVGYTTNDPLLLELRFTMPGSENNLRYATFPDEPAMQRVDLFVYVPQERDLIGRRGPWSPEMRWTIGDFFERHYVPTGNVNNLVSTMSSGINVLGDPLNDFPVDGKALMFTTLRPEHPDDGALRLSTINRKVLDAIVLVSFLTLGVSLLSQTYVTRFTVCLGLIGGFVLLGVFLPTLAGHVVDQTLLIAAVLVGLLWLAVSTVRWVPRMGRLAVAGAATVSSATTALAARTPFAPQTAGNANGGTSSPTAAGKVEPEPESRPNPEPLPEEGGKGGEQNV